MASITERNGNIVKMNANSKDVLKVNYEDTDEQIVYVNKSGSNWDTNNPTEDSGIVTPPAEIQFATDEEVEQAIQSIIDSWD